MLRASCRVVLGVNSWIAVRDMENGWASIGTDYPERLCRLHQEIDNGHYGKPSWGFDKFNHPIICCDDPDEVVWVKSLALSTSITWNEAQKACKAEGFSLCPHSQYCPEGEGKPVRPPPPPGCRLRLAPLQRVRVADLCCLIVWLCCGVLCCGVACRRHH